ncbi:hypothetical protein D9Q98_008902 [Chlorella vulgaris]|uniref:Protein kinase domain-containing protein n=1 Tax=Chlorella vulgaris TaxID=3077 RepID=A0A9D4TGU7_CHLVU|nr:hypothetical protein D9Q98_008902 [Chlorella vulgaris]
MRDTVSCVLVTSSKAAKATLFTLLLLLGAVSASHPLASAGEIEAELLLTFKAGITNWDEVAAERNLQGWTFCAGRQCLPVCNWSGIECSPFHTHDSGNFVTALRLNCRSGCTVPLRGQLTPGLHRLQHLVYLYLDGNELSGPLPVEWGEPYSFPELLELNLNDNQLTGNMPDIWSVGPAFEMLGDLQLAGNRLSGPFPAGFAVTNTSFWSVMSFNFADNQMTGPLPSYVNGMITMSIVRLENNQFTGTLPPDWGSQGYYWNSSYNSTQALEYLTLHGNRLTGTLPLEWGAPGAFTVLKQLTLSDNVGLVGTLPAAWGASNDSLPLLEDFNVSRTGLSGRLPEWGPYPTSLRALTLDSNNFTGTIPASWTELANLQEVTLQPGNPDLCPVAPPGSYFYVCDATDILCIDTLPHDTAACAGAQPADSSGFPVVAVVVPVAVVVAMAALAAGVLWRRRRRRQAGDQYASSTKQGADLDPECGCVFDSGKQLPEDPTEDKDAVCTSSAPALLIGLGPSRSVELEDQPSCSTNDGSVGAQSAPVWLPAYQQNLQPDPSGVLLPQQPSRSTGSSRAQASARTSEDAALPGRSSACASSMELPVLQLSDWEILPDEIEILKRADGTDWQLGAGGFGTVYKAMRNGVQPVAVKVLGSVNSGLVLKSMTPSDFAHEISILRACRATNVLQFQGACFQENRTLLVTEYMEGGNLTHNLRSKKVDWYRKGKKIGLDVARALVYLHSRKILHLDIKSANVLLTRDGTAKVGDVGMAKIMAGDYVSGAVGTLAWSAPELLMGQRCGAKADVYSFGVVLWEICTGEVPVRGQLRDPIVPDECPAEVLTLIHACLSPDPADRPSSTALVERLLEASVVLPPADLLDLPSGSMSPASSSIGPNHTGSFGPSTTSTTVDAAAQAGSHRSSTDSQHQQQPGVGALPPALPGQPQALVPQQQDLASLAPQASRQRQYVTAGKSITFTATRSVSSRPPRPAPAAQPCSLEESLVSELAEELLSGEVVPGAASGSRQAAPPPPLPAQPSESSEAGSLEDAVGGLQRRLVLTSNTVCSSPFTRTGPTPGSSSGIATSAAAGPRPSPFTRPPLRAVAPDSTGP